jgi:enoyl-CoA hydratase/carnithine racemase
VVEALERDNFMDPEQAKEWGLIDEIVESRVAMGGAARPRKVDGSQPRHCRQICDCEGGGPDLG